jgi:hypothetical protein
MRALAAAVAGAASLVPTILYTAAGDTALGINLPQQGPQPFAEVTVDVTVEN